MMDPHYRDALRKAHRRRNAAMVEPRRVLSVAKSDAFKRRQAARRVFEATLAQIERDLAAAIDAFQASRDEADAIEAEDIRAAHGIVRIVHVDGKRRQSTRQVSV